MGDSLSTNGPDGVSGDGISGDGGRRDAELVTALGSVRARIARACESVGRDPQDVTLIAVTKTRPAADIATLARLGVQDFGESKDQEARAKVDELGPLAAGLRWHLVGRLQTNKARSAGRYAHAVHSLDRPKLARALADAVAQANAETGSERRLDVFAQVSLDGDPERGGVAPSALDDLVTVIVEHRDLRLRGLMAVPPLGADPDSAFAQLADLSAALRARYPESDAISAGMSADLEAAVTHGATHVRVGSALLGRRPLDLG